MCDYSLERVASRAAQVGDKLISTSFEGTSSRGFATKEDCGTAVCLRPGTEVAFNDKIKSFRQTNMFASSPLEESEHQVARFTQVDLDKAYAHHDALVLPDGNTVMVHRLVEGQEATVLQLPSERTLTKEEDQLVQGAIRTGSELVELLDA